MDRFLAAERKAIEVAKWLKGVEIHSDPGNGFVYDWVESFAREFRDRWPSSKCKDCIRDCAYECKSFCDKYERDPKCL